MGKLRADGRKGDSGSGAGPRGGRSQKAKRGRKGSEAASASATDAAATAGRLDSVPTTEGNVVRELPEGGVLIVAGLPGYGKTHYLQEGLRASRRLPLPPRRRVLVIDPHSALDRSQRNPKRRPWEGEVITYSNLLRYDGEHLLASTGTLIIDPSSLDQAVVGRRVSQILAMAWHAQDWDVVLEEAGLYSRSAVPLINLLATGGGHAGIRLILIAQSIGRITIDARRNASRLALWPQSDPEDYRELRGKIGKAGVAELAAMPEPPPYSPPVTWRQGQVPSDPG